MRLCQLFFPLREGFQAFTKMLLKTADLAIAELFADK